MSKAVDLEFLKFLSEIGLTEESFSKQGFEEFRRWYGTFPPQEYAAYGEICHAYSQILKPLYTPGALKAAKQAFGRLLEGHPCAAEELLMVLDKSGPLVCWYIFNACQAGWLDPSVLGRVMRHLIDGGNLLRVLRESGRSTSEIVEMFVQANPIHIMSREEYRVFGRLPSEVTVYRGAAEKTVASIGKDMSWTLSREVALEFAEQHGRRLAGQRQLWHGIVKREDILAYLGDRDEEEVIVRPSRMRRLGRQVPRITEPESGNRVKVEEVLLDDIFHSGNGIWKILRRLA